MLAGLHRQHPGERVHELSSGQPQGSQAERACTRYLKGVSAPLRPIRFAAILKGTTCLALLLHPSCVCHLLVAIIAAWHLILPAPAVTAGREGSHALCMKLGPDDEPAHVPIRQGPTLANARGRRCSRLFRLST